MIMLMLCYRFMCYVLLKVAMDTDADNDVRRVSVVMPRLGEKVELRRDRVLGLGRLRLLVTAYPLLLPPQVE